MVGLRCLGFDVFRFDDLRFMVEVRVIWGLHKVRLKKRGVGGG